MKAVEIQSNILEALRKDDLNPRESEEDSIQKTDASSGEPKKRGGFTKGKSGNPAGRPKGALGKSTLVKQAIMAEAEGLLLKNAPKVISTVIEQAKKGCIQSQRLIWQSIIPAKRAVEISAKDEGPAVIKINIETLNTTNDKHEPAVEAEFIEIEEEDNGD